MLLIHCGLHKTGSTAIQNALKKIKARNLIFSQNSYKRLAELHKHRAWSQRIKRLAPHKNIVLSAENALGCMSSAYKEAEQRAQLIEETWNEVEYKLVICLRDQLSWLESVYRQEIQQGEAINPSDFIARITNNEHCSYAALINSLTKHISAERVVIIPYSNEIIQDFWKACGLSALIEEPSVTPSARANTSISACRAEYMRILNMISDSAAEKRVIRDYLQNRIPRLAEGEGFSCFSIAQQELIRSKYLCDWKFIVSRHGEGGSFNRTHDFILRPSIADIDIEQRTDLYIKEASLIIKEICTLGASHAIIDRLIYQQKIRLRKYLNAAKKIRNIVSLGSIKL